MKKVLSYFIIFLFPVFCFAQNPDFLPNDSLNKHKANKYYHILTKSGKEYYCILENETDMELTFITKDNKKITLSIDSIKKMELINEERFLERKYIPAYPFAYKYFFGNSAMPMEKGASYFNSISFGYGSYCYAISNHVALGLSTSVLGMPVTLNALSSFRIGSNIYFGPELHVGSLGWLFNWSPVYSYGGLKFTHGTALNNYTIGGGYAYFAGDFYSTSTYTDVFQAAYWNISGTTKLSKYLLLSMELWGMSALQINNNALAKNTVFVQNIGIKTMKRERSSWGLSVTGFILPYSVSSSSGTRLQFAVIPIPVISFSQKL